MGRRKKVIKTDNRQFQAVVVPSAWGFEKTLVLRIIDIDNHQVITYDKRRGHQKWFTPHNVPLDTNISSNEVECPQLVKYLRRIYNV